MDIGMPAYPTLMELRTAGWTLEQISAAYGVPTVEIRRELALHFMQAKTWTPSLSNDRIDHRLPA